MASLLAAILALAAAIALSLLPPPTRAADGTTRLRRGLVGLLLLLPLFHATLVLRSSSERLDSLRFDYVGKHLSFDAANPVTAGGSPADAAEVEDLNAIRLSPFSVRLVKPPEDWTADPAGAAGDSPPPALLRLTSPSPAVSVDESYCNSYPLEHGDRIVVQRADEDPVVLTYQTTWLSASIRHGDKEITLQGPFARFFGGARRAYDLARLGVMLEAPVPGVLSFLRHTGTFGPWQLLIRSDEVVVERQGQTVASFVAEHPVPAEFDLSLDVILEGAVRRQRQDHLRVLDDRVLVEFDDTRSWSIPVDSSKLEMVLAITVPSAFSEHESIELPEPSGRFRGLSAVYRYKPSTAEATLRYFGSTEPVVPGELYALGTGLDRLLLRIDHRGYPRHLLFDLGLLALFFAVFLGRGMTAHSGLAAIIGPVGILLGHRLLFSHKAAIQPPDFAIEPFVEARLALWLVPALLLAGWTAAWILRVPVASAAPTLGAVARRLGWPLLGLATAAVGCWVVAHGSTGSRQAMALLPLLLAAGLLLVELLRLRWRRARAAIERLQDSGIPWRVGWLTLVGVLILLVRWLASTLGMPETLRLSFIEFRLLWTVLQLPVVAVTVGLTLHALGRPSAAERPSVRKWLCGLVTVWIFLFLAFLAVGQVVHDTGLVLVHGLAPITGLLLLVAVPLSWNLPAWKQYCLAALPALLLIGVLLVNAYPRALIHVVGWGVTSEAAEGTAPAPVRDTAAQLSSTRAQQLFRLYMLANPQSLEREGVKASERVAVHYATLQNYADEGGFWGTGYLAAQLPRHLGITFLSDLVPMVFVLPEFGIAGLFGVALLYAALLVAVPLTARALPGDDRLSSQGLAIALLALLAVTLPSLYMILANLNLVLFTGKNMSLLSLNSISDVLQGGTLLATAVLGLGLRRGEA